MAMAASVRASSIRPATAALMCARWIGKPIGWSSPSAAGAAGCSVGSSGSSGSGIDARVGCTIAALVAMVVPSRWVMRTDGLRRFEGILHRGLARSSSS